MSRQSGPCSTNLGGELQVRPGGGLRPRGFGRVGSTEQHGPTGLIGTDALTAEMIGRGAGEKADDENELADAQAHDLGSADIAAGDPRREVAVTFDDRRRLEDRIFRLRTGHAWSQAPASRTVRLVTNVEVFLTDSDAVRMVRANFLITEFWGDETRILSGWSGYRMVAADGRWEIAAKQVNLLECDQCIRNPSIIL